MNWFESDHVDSWARARIATVLGERFTGSPAPAGGWPPDTAKAARAVLADLGIRSSTPTGRQEIHGLAWRYRDRAVEDIEALTAAELYRRLEAPEELQALWRVAQLLEHDLLVFRTAAIREAVL